MKRLFFVTILVLMSTAFAVAQGQPPASAPAVAPLAITGKIDIDYKTRVQQEDGKPAEGVKDLYRIDLNVANSVQFQGTIEHLPTILSSVLGRETQGSQLSYNLSTSVINPANPQERRTVGKLVGTVPIDKKGVYQYDQGNLRMAIDATGKAAGFESKFQGQAAGKPPKNTSLAARVKKQAKTITRTFNGKTLALRVTDYDEMGFIPLVLAAGPVKGSYPEARCNGTMLYDYERSAWYFNGVTVSYTTADGKTVSDRLSGNVKWVESPGRATNGEGEYQFDVRVNEPEAGSGDGAVFAPADNEADFFASDTRLPCLTGTARYKDQMRGETVTSSVVAINLAANNLNKAQVGYLAKLVWLVSVVPMNAE